MRRGLSTYIVGGGHGLQIADDRVVRGKIEWDIAHDTRVPLLIIDGPGKNWAVFC